MTTKKQPANDLTFEEKLAKLEQIVAWFESEGVTLGESMQHFEQGMQLAEALEKELSQAENQVKIIKQKFEKAV
jgi:exodeoxyribonuclease VII small subunit